MIKLFTSGRINESNELNAKFISFLFGQKILEISISKSGNRDFIQIKVFAYKAIGLHFSKGHMRYYPCTKCYI